MSDPVEEMRKAARRLFWQAKQAEIASELQVRDEAAAKARDTQVYMAGFNHATQLIIDDVLSLRVLLTEYAKSAPSGELKNVVLAVARDLGRIAGEEPEGDQP